MRDFYATTAGTAWCQPLCVLLFLSTATFLCTGAAGNCPCRALSPHLHGKRFCTRCGNATLGECPNSAHSFTYYLHHISAFSVSRSKCWDFLAENSGFPIPGRLPESPDLEHASKKRLPRAHIRASRRASWPCFHPAIVPRRLYVPFTPPRQSYTPFLPSAP